MTQFIPGAEHVEVPYEHPGRGGGQVQLLERDGKWLCPRSGPSLVQQYAKEGVNAAGAFGVGLGVGWMVFPTFAFGVGSGWFLWNWLRRKKDKTAPP
jgi:hypothetical protein